MANKNLFKSQTSTPKIPAATAVNHAGGTAYAFADKEKLAQMAIVGTLGDTYYASASSQMADVIALCANLSPEYIGKVAIYSRKHSFMKDMPALLCAVLANKDVNVLKVVFPLVMDNGKMVKNFVQIIRSGAVGRKSFGTAIKKLIHKWFAKRSAEQLFRDSVGNDPSLADVIRLIRPVPESTEKEALYAYIIGRKVVNRANDMEKDKYGRATTVLMSALPSIVQQYEKYKSAILKGEGKNLEVPNVEFRLLTALNLGEAEWSAIAKTAPWHMARMNLNTFQRHGVFKNAEMITTVAKTLADRPSIEKSKVFPYQLMAAYKNVEHDMPAKIVSALQDALEISTENIPRFPGKVYICVDVSGSMGSPVTGSRGTASTKVSCRDVGALIASAILRKNEDAEVICFSDDVVPCRLNPRDSVMSNSNTIARLPSGGTSCSAPIRKLNSKNAQGDLIIMVSDNESWADMSRGGGTSAQGEWMKFKKNNPKARFVSIDLTPNSSSQVKGGSDVLFIGGFSDDCFMLIDLFARGVYNGSDFVAVIENTELEASPVMAVAKAGVKIAASKRK